MKKTPWPRNKRPSPQTTAPELKKNRLRAKNDLQLSFIIRTKCKISFYHTEDKYHLLSDKINQTWKPNWSLGRLMNRLMKNEGVERIFELVQRAQKGDDEAFLELFQRYENDLYRMAFVYVKNQEDALDVVQETAYRAFKNISTLRNPAFFKTWLLKISIAYATDLLRKRQKVVFLNPDYPEWIGMEGEDVSMNITLKQILESLDEHEKSIIFLKFYDDLTFKEIAEVKDIPLGTVKTVMYRALEKLRVQMKGADIYEQWDKKGTREDWNSSRIT